MENFSDEVLLKEKVDYKECYGFVNGFARVKNQDDSFSLWRKTNDGDFKIMSLREYNSETEFVTYKISFPMATNFSKEGVCVLVNKEKKNMKEGKFWVKKWVDVVRYAVFRDGHLQVSTAFENAYEFKDGMGRVQKISGQNASWYSYVTIDDKKNFVYLNDEYQYAFDFNNGVAEVRSKTGMVKLIDKTGKVIDENYSVTRKKAQAEKNKIYNSNLNM